jgi:hypothetical protein
VGEEAGRGEGSGRLNRAGPWGGERRAGERRSEEAGTGVGGGGGGAGDAGSTRW